jgi:poly-gamma-glutamate synthesis protein (capsule biosynthesis protein)
LLLLALGLFAACSGDTTPVALPTAGPSPTTPTPAASTGDGVITIAAVGDVSLGRQVAERMEQQGALYPFELVTGLLQDAGLTIANMENALTERGAPAGKLFTFRAPPRFAEGLAQAGIDIVSLANNHTADFGPDGVADTLAALDDAGVLHAGAGMDGAQARRPAFVEVGGLRLAFLSYTDVPENTFAGPDSPGVALATTDAIAQDVAAARAQAGVVVVALHFGIEYTDAPQPEQQLLARAAIDAGALLVLGHHPHTLQGWERYNGGLIIYSLGNFVFDLDDMDLANLGPRAYQTAVLYVTLSENEVLDVRAQPVAIEESEDRPRPPTVDEAAAILARIDELNTFTGGE